MTNTPTTDALIAKIMDRQAEYLGTEPVFFSRKACEAMIVDAINRGTERGAALVSKPRAGASGERDAWERAEDECRHYGEKANGERFEAVYPADKAYHRGRAVAADEIRAAIGNLSPLTRSEADEAPGGPAKYADMAPDERIAAMADDRVGDPWFMLGYFREKLKQTEDEAAGHKAGAIRLALELRGLKRGVVQAPGVEIPAGMDTAPTDGTMVRLLIDYTDGGAALEDATRAWTIGFNNLGNIGEDRWQFAGWCWTHDHFTHGTGAPVGWLPWSNPSTGGDD